MSFINTIKSFFSKERKETTFNELFRKFGFTAIFVVDTSLSVIFFTSLGEGWILLLGGIALSFMKIWNWIRANESFGARKYIHYTAWFLIMLTSVYAAVNFGLSNTSIKANEAAIQAEASAQQRTIDLQLESAQATARVANIGLWTQEKTQILARIANTESSITSKTEALELFRKENGATYPETQRRRQAEIDGLVASLVPDRARLGVLDGLLTEALAPPPKEETAVVAAEVPEENITEKLNAEIVFRQTLGDYFRIGIIIFFFIFGTAIELTVTTSAMKPQIETEEQKRKRLEKKEKRDEHKMMLRDEREKLKFQKYQIEQSLKFEKYRLKMEAQKKQIINRISLEENLTSEDLMSILGTNNSTTRARKKRKVELPPKEETEFVVDQNEEEETDTQLNTNFEAKLESVEHIVENVTEKLIESRPFEQTAPVDIIKPAEPKPAELKQVEEPKPAEEPKPVELKQVEEPKPVEFKQVEESIEESKPVEEPVKEQKPIEREKISNQLKQKLESESKQNAQLLFVINKLFDKIDHGGQHLLTADEAVRIIPGIDKNKVEKIFKFLSYNNTIYYDGLQRAWKPKMEKQEVLDVVETKLTKVKGA